MIMTKSQEKRSEIVHAVNTPKSQLLRLLNQLENAPGNSVPANELATIIYKLENWQNRYM